MSANKIRKIDKENREYKERWEMEYLFVKRDENSVCLFCLMNTTIHKEYNLKRHYQTNHESKYARYVGESRNVMIQKLKNQFKQQTSLFTSVKKDQDSSLSASFAVTINIAKAKKSFTDGELIKKCAIDMARSFGEEKIAKQFETVSLSHQTVARRVSVIDTYLQEKLEEVVKVCSYFSITLDESTDISHTSQLLIFIRMIDNDFNISEELLNLASLHGTTKGADIYDKLNSAIVKYGGFGKCTAIVTDGAKSMIGKHIGLAGLLQQNGINCQMHHSSAIFMWSNNGVD